MNGTRHRLDAHPWREWIMRAFIRVEDAVHVGLCAVLALADTVDIRDRDSNGHAQVVGRYAELIAPEPIDAEAVKTLLRPDEAVVTFLSLKDRLLVWMVRRGMTPP